MAKKQLRATTSKPILLDEINENIGVANEYKAMLSEMVQAMCSDYDVQLKKAIKSGDNYFAFDDKAQTSIVDRALSGLMADWQKRFNKIAEEYATKFAKSALRHTDISLFNVLKKAGFTVKFTMSRPVQAALKVVVANNVSLIKSIQSQYHTQVVNLTWDAVKKGGDLQFLTNSLTDRFGITLDRAKRIAFDQNKKARQEFEDMRRNELGIEEAEWWHSHAGKEPRQSHEAAHKKRYKIKQGCYIDGEYIKPGEKPGCKCGSRAIIPGING